jgi:murein L,D-transpeptidase YcbB/YkuD
VSSARAEPSALARHRWSGRAGRRRRRLVALGLGFGVLVLAAAASLAPTAAGWLTTRFVRGAMQAEIEYQALPDGMADFYRARGYRPLWIDRSPAWPALRLGFRPDAAEAVRAVAKVPELAGDRKLLARTFNDAKSGDARDMARAELALSAAVIDYVRFVRTPRSASLAFSDPALPTGREPRGILDDVARSGQVGDYLAAVDHGNPLYHGLSEALVAYRSRWSALPQIPVTPGSALAVGDEGERVIALRKRLGLKPPGGFDGALETQVRRFQAWHGLPQSGQADAATVDALNRGPAAYERLIQLNMDRARALPILGARRYLVVNVPAGELTFHEDGKTTGAMPVVVGTPKEPTPMMAALMRSVVLNPYWDVPVDLARDSLAPKVLASGPAYFAGRNMEALSDWTDQAKPLDPKTIDWKAVADGSQDLRVRQKPGGDNMMGRVKFMMPNELGIYLHDTPEKGLFDREQRQFSAGCVRVSDAPRLMAWLFGGSPPNPARAGLEHAVQLSEATPVYITYLTVAPTPFGLDFYPDAYGWDAAR